MLELMEASKCINTGIDMAAHNILCYYYNYPVYKYDNMSGPVWTIGKTENITINKHKFYRPDGNMPTIIHQYDRHVTWI